MRIYTYVVSLVTSIDRRNKIAQQLKSLSFDFSFHDAYDLRCANISDVNKHILSDEIYNRPLKKLARGEVGCAISHQSLLYKINENCLHQNENILILEDDAILDPKIIDFLHSKKLDSMEWDVIILGYSKLSKRNRRRFYIKEPIKMLHMINGVKLGKVWKEWTCGTVGYLVNRKSIKKFNMDGVYTVADDWEYLYKKLGLIIYHCRPLLVEEDFIELPSSIENERKTYIENNWSVLEVIRYLRGGIRRLVMFFTHN